MADLEAVHPWTAGLPATHGGVTLRALPPERLSLILPFPGRAAACDTALRAAHGVGLPAPGSSGRSGGTAVLWFARDAALLVGPQPDVSLRETAALSDQSDGWAAFLVDGPDDAVAAVLARVVPVDLRRTAFPDDAVARTLLRDMPVLIHREPRAGIRVMAWRSMAGDAAIVLTRAMAAVAGRAALA